LQSETDELSVVFGALADPTRRAILSRLTRGPATVGDLATPFTVSAPAISQHLKVLERAERFDLLDTHLRSLKENPDD